MTPPRVQRHVLHQQRRLPRHLAHRLREEVSVNAAVGGGQGLQAVEHDALGGRGKGGGGGREEECVKRRV
jgi:hypothetical protein